MIKVFMYIPRMLVRKTPARQGFHLSWSLLLAISVGMGLWRLGQHSWQSPIFQFTPIGALALFIGAYFKNTYKAYVLPVLALFFSDVFITKVVYAAREEVFLYKDFWLIYLSFAMMVPLGGRILQKISVWRVGISGVAAALIHWVVTDIGPCFFGGLDVLGTPYGTTWQGITRCYLSAIPWSLRFLYATWFYGAVLFGGVALYRYLTTFFTKRRQACRLK